MQVGDVQTKAQRRDLAASRWREHLQWRAVTFQARQCPHHIDCDDSHSGTSQLEDTISVNDPTLRGSAIQSISSSYFLKRARNVAPLPKDPGVEMLMEGTDDMATADTNDDETDGRREAQRRRLESRQAQLQAELARWNPSLDPRAMGDPSCTVFVARLSPAVTDSDLRAFGDGFGRVLRVRVVRALDGASRRYGFLVFTTAREAQRAARDGGGMLLRGKRVVVDMERGRLGTQSFRPKRLMGVSVVKKEASIQPTCCATMAQAATAARVEEEEERDEEAELLRELLG